MGHQVDRAREILRILGVEKPPEPGFMVRRIFKDGGRSWEQTSTEDSGQTPWSSAPFHEALELLSAIPRRRYAREVFARSVADRYADLGGVESASPELAFIAARARYWTSNFTTVPLDRRELWNAARVWTRREFVGVLDRRGLDERGTFDRVIDVVSGFLIPSGPNQPHYFANQLWIYQRGNRIRKAIVEIPFEETTLSSYDQDRRLMFDALGYEVFEVNRFWALIDPVRAVIDLADQILGTDLSGRLVRPATMQDYECIVCGEVLTRNEPRDIVKIHEDVADWFTPKFPFHDGYAHGHLDCTSY